ncbi:MAG: prepilin-type N-terminal cleavage/methylation domain-containing protein [Nitrospirae bacterium]|nr:prepilin-type N-terminal cleavage/methylation domain-containing protein [Nitrospirota bacterium]
MKMYSQKGFSITEVLVTVAILSVVLAALYSVLISQHRTYEAQRDVAITQRDVRAAISLLERDVRTAGLGVPRGSNPVAEALNSNPDSIRINFSPGPLTYLLSSTVESPGNIIQVNSVNGFTVGERINIISNENNNLVGEYTINAINTGDKKLSLSSDPSSDGTIDVGFFVARDFKTITYSVTVDAGTGRSRLIRDDGTVQSIIVDGVVDFQLSYILDDGSETTAPADLTDIRRVRIDLTGETIKEAARVGAQQIQREITTIVPVKNVRL